MKRVLWAFLVALGLAGAVGASVLAQDAPPLVDPVYNPNFGLVTPPEPTPGFTQRFDPGTPSQAEIQGLQGPGGFGYNDYTGALFNMPEVFGQFTNRDLSSTLALDLMTYNLALPQTAALFQQLNTFGNERYQQFLLAYPLSAQQQDARNRYLQQCMPEVRASLGGISGDATVNAQANARSAELCLQRYTVQARDLQLQKNQTYAQFLRDAQDVNKMIQPLICPPRSGATAEANAICWPNFLLPQVRLCNADITDDAGRKVACDANNFGVQPAPVSMQALMNTFIYGLGVSMTEVSINPFLRAIAVADGATLREAARIAGSQMAVNQTAPAAPFPEVAALQTEFLGCSDPNMLRGLQKLGQGVFEATFADAGNNGQQGPRGDTLGEQRRDALQPPAPGFTLFTPQMRTLLATYMERDAAASSADDMAKAMYIASGCAANREIPFLDPMAVVTMRNTCSPDDLQSYFKVAAVDVAEAATRSLLLYTKQQLELAKGRLEADDPLGLSYTPASGVSETVDSPATRKRLATAIETIMLKQIDNDLARLEALRTASSQSPIRKVTQGIYKNRGGCLSERTGQ